MPWAFWHKFQFVPVLAPGVVIIWLSVPLMLRSKAWLKLASMGAALALAGAIVMI